MSHYTGAVWFSYVFFTLRRFLRKPAEKTRRGAPYYLVITLKIKALLAVKPDLVGYFTVAKALPILTALNLFHFTLCPISYETDPEFSAHSGERTRVVQNSPSCSHRRW
jgi:hypothetical protein